MVYFHLVSLLLDWHLAKLSCALAHARTYIYIYIYILDKEVRLVVYNCAFFTLLHHHHCHHAFFLLPLWQNYHHHHHSLFVTPMATAKSPPPPMSPSLPTYAPLQSHGYLVFYLICGIGLFIYGGILDFSKLIKVTWRACDKIPFIF